MAIQEKKIILILLIGTNPLPNYVIAYYFKDKIHQLILVYSEEYDNQAGTKDYADAIKDLIQVKNISLISLRDINSAERIYINLREKLSFDNGYTPHLNYTGGTKPMAVHVYNFIKELYSNAIFSYLDARTYKIVYNNGLYEPKSGDLRDQVKVDINVMLRLHLYNKLDAENNDSTSYVIENLNDLIKTDRIKIFIDWFRSIRIVYKNGKDIIEKKAKYVGNFEDPCTKKAIKCFENMPDFVLKILNAFPENKKLNDNSQKSLWKPDKSVSNRIFKERVKKTFEFLDGKWFEIYIYNILKSSINWLAEGKNLGFSLEAKREEKNFELDIFLIRGYQLIGISITTSDDIKLCKHKGFEVIHRVRQIGGDEGIAILITGLACDTAENLNKDLYHMTGSIQDKFFIFALNDWKDIGKKIIKVVEL